MINFYLQKENEANSFQRDKMILYSQIVKDKIMKRF